jgi:hypothetical protein
VSGQLYDRHPDHCKSERRRGEDHHGHQSRCRHFASKEENAPDRPRSAIQSTITFFDLADIQTSMFDVLGDHRAEMASVIKTTKDPMLSVAPARLALAKLEQQLSGQFDAPFKLKDALAPV